MLFELPELFIPTRVLEDRYLPNNYYDEESLKIYGKSIGLITTHLTIY